MGEELAKAVENKVAFTIPLFGGISVNESVVVTWIIMGIIMLLVLLMTRNLKIVPSKPQALLELAVSWVNHFLEGCTGKAGKRYYPYLATVLLYLGFSNLIGLFGSCSANQGHQRNRCTGDYEHHPHRSFYLPGTGRHQGILEVVCQTNAVADSN